MNLSLFVSLFVFNTYVSFMGLITIQFTQRRRCYYFIFFVYDFVLCVFVWCYIYLRLFSFHFYYYYWIFGLIIYWYWPLKHKDFFCVRWYWLCEKGTYSRALSLSLSRSSTLRNENKQRNENRNWCKQKKKNETKWKKEKTTTTVWNKWMVIVCCVSFLYANARSYRAYDLRYMLLFLLVFFSSS